MNPTKYTTFKVNIRTEPHGGDIGAFLDMLRYEGGEVIDWGRWDEDRPPFRHGFTVTIRVEARYFQPDRWASFMIYPKVVG